MDKSFHSILSFRSGFCAALSASVDHPGHNIWELAGTKGSMAIPRHDPHGNGTSKVLLINDDGEATNVACEYQDQFELEFRNFANAILGKSPQHIRPEESMLNAQLLEQIRASFIKK